MEIWKPIVGFEGTYEISSKGCIRRSVKGAGGRAAGMIIKARRDTKGYLRTLLFLGSGKGYKCVSPHIAVLEAFVGPRPNGYDASHKNGINNDNRLENLCWETRSKNHQRKLRHGTLQHGDRHRLAKLDWGKVREIRERAKRGDRPIDMAKEFGVTPTLIVMVIKRKAWMHAE